MKYLKIFLLSLMMLTITPASLTLAQATAQQTNDGWEYIGDTTAVNPRNDNDNITGKLFVKVVVNTLMYKFEDAPTTTYSVIQDYGENGYNASINKKGKKYYLRVPTWKG